MIAEVLTRKTSRPFKGLADYLNGKPGRVETSFFLNCSFDDFELNLKEIKALQSLARAKADKTYHFVISLREGEKFNNKEIKRTVKMQLKTLGYENHQALVTVHNDTANFHIHVGVNKVCPKTKGTITPYKDYEKLDKTCAKLEKIFGLQHDNRIGQGTNKTKRLYDGRQSFQEWVTELSPEIMNQVENASSWPELHEALAKYNLCIRERGAGFVLSDRDKKLFIKASAVDRKLSKKSLEELFGKFEKTNLKTLTKPILQYEGIPKGVKKHSPIFKEFTNIEKDKKIKRQKEINILYDQYNNKIITLKQWYSDCKQDLEKDWFIGKKERNMVLTKHRQTMKNNLDKLHSDFQKQKNRVVYKTPPMGWNTYLLNQAERGTKEALSVLRDKLKKNPLVENNFIVKQQPNIILFGFNKVSRHGELIYKFGKVQLRDTGKQIFFFGDLSDKKGLAQAVRLISDNEGKNLLINGTKEFKKTISATIQHDKKHLHSKNIQYSRGR
jgi:hypothetical protein